MPGSCGPTQLYILSLVISISLFRPNLLFLSNVSIRCRYTPGIRHSCPAAASIFALAVNRTNGLDKGVVLC